MFPLYSLYTLRLHTLCTYAKRVLYRVQPLHHRYKGEEIIKKKSPQREQIDQNNQGKTVFLLL
jgi:hypothetical protein